MSDFEDDRFTASVKWYSDEKGYGFLTQDNGNQDVFIHASNVPRDGGALQPGDRVSFETQTSDRGIKAVKVMRI